MSIRDQDIRVVVWRRIGSAWGVLGILLVLLWAIYRLTPHALGMFDEVLNYGHWIVLAVWCLFMLATEGYDGFQRRLAPRIAARAREIREAGDVVSIVLAPLYCFGYFRAPWRRMLVSYAAIILIVCAVIVVHQLPQPWRGIVDWGVVIGLSYGCVAIICRAIAQ